MIVAHSLAAASAHAHGPVPAVRHFARTEVIYSQGDFATCWFDVVQGTVMTCRYLSDGRRQVTGFAMAGDVIGVEGPRRDCSAEALTLGSLICHPVEAPRHAANETDEPHLELRRALRAARDSLALLGHRTAIERVSAFLLALARRIPGGGAIDLPMSRADLADYLGLTMHTVSRTISELARRQLLLLESPQRLRLLDTPALARIAGGDEADDPLARHGDIEPRIEEVLA